MVLALSQAAKAESRCLRRGSGVLADVKYRDSLKVLGWYFSKDVHVRSAMFGMVPGFPNRCQLHNDLDLVRSVIRQGHQSSQECTNFCLGSSGHSSDCAQPLKLSQGHGVSARPKIHI